MSIHQSVRQAYIHTEHSQSGHSLIVCATTLYNRRSWRRQLRLWRTDSWLECALHSWAPVSANWCFSQEQMQRWMTVKEENHKAGGERWMCNGICDISLRFRVKTCVFVLLPSPPACSQTHSPTPTSLLPDSLRIFLALMMCPVKSRNGNNLRAREQSYCGEPTRSSLFVISKGEPRMRWNLKTIWRFACWWSLPAHRRQEVGCMCVCGVGGWLGLMWTDFTSCWRESG